MPGSHVFVAESEGRVVGSAGLFPLGKSSRFRHAAMFGISVHPEAQGQGVGDALMRAVIEQADHWLGLTRIVLEVFVDNERARALYERHGFVLEGVERAMALRRGAHADSYLMARVR
jgi:putative acetyltransferase